MITERATGTDDVQLKRALLALQKMQAKLVEMERARSEPIAIISQSCRFADVDSPEAFWHLLHNGVDAVTEIPPSRWDIDAYYDPDPDKAGKMYVRHGSFIANIDQFDPLFFGISPREAELMDPQQRLLLEVSWEALERAGIVPQSLRGSNTGVFVGMMNQDYAELANAAGIIEPHSGPGNGYGMAAGRISYVLGLQGPNLSLDTQCSSSLVAVHLAVNSLRNHECNLALAGGVNLILSPTNTMKYCRTRAYSPDGRCKTFDASADGMISSEGCGVVLLKRLADAEADGDPILAVIRGTAVNHDGASSGFTVPNQLAQEALIRQALANAQVTADDISYIEAHGTGTSLGDPIEVNALSTVFGKRQRPLYLGSVKTNLGHTDAAAGIAGLIKTVLSLQHGEIPPHLNLETPTPHIPWERLPFRIPTELAQWPDPGMVPNSNRSSSGNGHGQTHGRLAGISSFGMSGTNAHVIVEEWVPQTDAAAPPQPAAQGALSTPMSQLLTLSAKTPEALVALAQRYSEWLPQQASHGDAATALATVCHAANTTRTHFGHRLAVVAASAESMTNKLVAFAQGDPTYVATGEATTSRRAKLAFLFTGQGSQYAHMGRELYETESVFRDALEQCDALLQTHPGESILAVIYPPDDANTGTDTIDTEADTGLDTEKNDQLDQTQYTQPAIFALEYALAQLWLSWGVQPDVVLGHSVGEYVAACVAGVFSLDDALKLVAARGQLMGALPQNGAMVVVELDESRARRAIARHQNQVAIAAVNGPENLVLSGAAGAIERIVDALRADGIKVTPLKVSHAFHSPLMEPMLADFRRVATSIAYSKPDKLLISNVTGAIATEEVATPAYWVRHVRASVRFADSVETLKAQKVRFLVEVGPKPTLLGMARQVLDTMAEIGAASPDQSVGQNISMLPSLTKNQPDRQQILESLGALYVQGMQISWGAVHGDAPRQNGDHQLSLPTYPFQRRRYWLDTPTYINGPSRQQPSISPLIDAYFRLPSERKLVVEKQLTVGALPFLVDHQIFEVVAIPGAYHVSTVLDTMRRLFPEQPCGVENVVFRQVLTIEEGQVCRLQLILSLDEAAVQTEQLAQFEIYSYVEDQHEPTPQLIASGQVVPVRRDDAAKQQPQPELLEQFRAQCPHSIELSDIYAQTVEHEIWLGPAFQWMHAPRRGEKKSLAQLRLPETVESISEYSIHPGMLDSCFLVASTTIEDEDHDPSAGVFLPFGVESVELFAPIQGNKWWCYAEEVSTHCWNIQLFDESATPVARIEGYLERPVTAERVRGAKAWQQWLYDVTWQPLDTLPLLAPKQTGTHGESTSSNTCDASSLQSDLVSSGSHWLIFADETGMGSALREQLQAHGAQVTLVKRGEAYEAVDAQTYRIDPDCAADYEQIFATIPDLQGIVYLWSLDETVLAQPPIDPHSIVRLSCDSTLHIIQQALDVYQTLPHLWLVTSAAQSVLPGDRVHGFAQSPLWGVGRSLMQEHPDFRCTCIDLEKRATSDYSAAVLTTELLAAHKEDAQLEDQIAWRYGRRYGLRLASHDSSAINDAEPLRRLECLEPGPLEQLQQRPYARREPAADEVEIRVHATGLNFSDVLKAMGLYPQENPPLGAECAGVVVGVGAGVSEFQVGDAVVSTADGCFAPYVTTKTDKVFPKPRSLTFSAAASVLETFATAAYALRHVAQVQPGDRVLIHAAAGGVGMAAIQIAQQVGAEIFATASPAKWDALRSMGVEHLYHSRNLDFAEQILADTDGAGATIVLNSLTGAGFVEKNFAVLAEGGRYVELSKRDVWDELQVEELRPDVTYTVMDRGEVAEKQPTLMRSLFLALLAEFDSGRLTLPPVTTFSMEQVAEAFQYMQQAKHIGKIVVTQPALRRGKPRADRSYLITGGLSGLGLQTAQWLGKQGAGQLILVGRSTPKPENESILTKLEMAGVQVVIAQADVADPEQIAAVVDAIDPRFPLAGVVHAAGVIDDGALINLDWKRFASVFAPKIRGTWNLHNATLSCDLDFFILFSSNAALLGSAGQANYAAANQFLDTFARYRQQQGLPATSIDWATWSGVGMAAAILDKFDMAGETVIEPTTGTQIFAALLATQSVQISVLPITDMQRFCRKFAHMPSLLAAMLPTKVQTKSAPGKRQFDAGTQQTPTHTGQETQSLAEQLQHKSARQAQKILQDAVRQLVLQVLKLDPAHPLNISQGLFDLGLDSLLALELRNRLQKQIAIKLSTTFIFDHPSIEAIVTYLADEVLDLPGGIEAEHQTETDAPLSPAQEGKTPLPVGTLDASALAKLSENALAELLQRKMAAKED